MVNVEIRIGNCVMGFNVDEIQNISIDVDSDDVEFCDSSDETATVNGIHIKVTRGKRKLPFNG